MGKRKAAGEVGAETSTHPQAGAGAGSADSPGSALRNLKLKRLNEFMNELEDAYRAAVTKAMAGKNREQRAVITKVLDDMRQQLFDLLRQNSVDDDDVGGLKLLCTLLSLAICVTITILTMDLV